MIYLDYAATTPVREEVLTAMQPYYQEMYYNPAAYYQSARAVSQAVERARQQVANLIGAKSDEIYFTASGTEADNWAIKGVMDQYLPTEGQVITTTIEHEAIRKSCHWLANKGYPVIYLSVDKQGRVDMEALEKVLAEHRPTLLSVIAGNNEIGTIQPMSGIGSLAKRYGVLYHSDAVAAVGQIPIDVKQWGVDLLSLSGHKLYGPKGIGVLYIKKGTKIGSFVSGGGQERGLRSGTSNVPAIVGLGKAAELLQAELLTLKERQQQLQTYLHNRVLSEIDGSCFNGAWPGKTEQGEYRRLPGNLHFTFRGLKTETLLTRLDMAGIVTSAGSACQAGALSLSHVLMAIGYQTDSQQAHLRVSIGRQTTQLMLDRLIEQLKTIVP